MKVTYKKLNGEVVVRNVVPIGFELDEDNKVDVIDLTEYSEAEQEYYETQLLEARRKYTEHIYALGLRSNFRRFLVDKIV